MKDAGLELTGVNMLKVKRCANCPSNDFKLIGDNNTINVVCANCGQSYVLTSVKRLPDDMIASQAIKISVQSTKELICLT